MASIKSFRGVPWANIKSVNGLAVANIKSINGVSAAVSPYLIEENCEAGTTPASWTDSGAVGWGDTTATVLQGSKQLYIPSGAYSKHDLTHMDTLYLYCLLKCAALPTGIATIFGLRVADGTPVCLMRLASTGAIGIYCNAADASVVGLISAGQNNKYHVWMTYIKSGTCTIGWSTDGTRPTSGNNFTSKAANATEFAQARAGNNVNTGSVYIDRLLVSTSQIGDNP